jgi:iron(III) transport system substrate-binding protein
MRRTRWVRATAIASMSAVAMLLVGCSSSGASSGASNSAAALTGQALANTAKAEGALTWYTSYTETQTTALIKKFNQTYPGIKVTTLQGTASVLAARLETEQRGGTYNADLFQGDASYAQLLLNQGALQPYAPPDRPTPPESLGLPSAYENVDAVLTTVIAYNPAALKQDGLTPPTSLQDLTKPEWKGKFSADYTAVNWYESLIKSMGHEQAKALIDALGNNSPLLVESHTLALTQVQGGEPPASIAVYGYLAAKTAKQTPDRLAFVNPNPLPSSPDLIDLVKNAPHPAAAELFMTWLLSTAGQEAMHEISGRVSLRGDVTTQGDAWDEQKWAPAWAQPSLAPATINSYEQEMKEAFHVG